MTKSRWPAFARRTTLYTPSYITLRDIYTCLLLVICVHCKFCTTFVV